MVTLLFVIADSFHNYKPGIPLVRSNSAAIRAACHRPATDAHASNEAVMWGVVDHKCNDQVRKWVGHCTFTSFEIEAPRKGRLYAGLEKKQGS